MKLEGGLYGNCGPAQRYAIRCNEVHGGGGRFELPEAEPDAPLNLLSNKSLRDVREL